MKNLMLYISISYLLISCEQSFIGEEYLIKTTKGKIELENINLGTPKFFTKGVTVFLSKNIEGNPYLIKTETDSLGEYKFENIPNIDSLFLIAVKEIGGVKFKSSKKIALKDENILILNPEYYGKQIVITVRDDKDVLNNIDVYLFVNKNQTKSISEDTPTNFIQTKQVSNQNGKVIFYDLKSTKYYLVAKKGKVTTEVDSVTLSNETSSIPKDLIFKPITKVPKLTLKLFDNIGDLISGIETFIFSSKISQGNIYTKVVTNHIANGLTNSKGEIVFSDLPDNQNLYIASKGYFLKNNKIDTTYAFLEKPIKLSKDTTVSLSFK